MADIILRHFVFDAEISIGKYLKVNLGFNDMRRQELAISTRKGLSGFSFGATIKFDRFNIGYSRSSYNIVNGINHFTLGINLGEYFPKKKK